MNRTNRLFAKLAFKWCIHSCIISVPSIHGCVVQLTHLQILQHYDIRDEVKHILLPTASWKIWKTNKPIRKRNHSIWIIRFKTQAWWLMNFYARGMNVHMINIPNSLSRLDKVGPRRSAMTENLTKSESGTRFWGNLAVRLRVSVRPDRRSKKAAVFKRWACPGGFTFSWRTIESPASRDAALTFRSMAPKFFGVTRNVTELTEFDLTTRRSVRNSSNSVSSNRELSIIKQRPLL